MFSPGRLYFGFERVFCLPGVLGHALASSEPDGSDTLCDAVEAVRGVIERAKDTMEKASCALGTLHRGVFPEKEVWAELEALAGSFDADDMFLE